MQSFVFETDSNKNNSVQKSTNDPPLIVNPFFQYVTNNQPLAYALPQKDKVVDKVITSSTPVPNNNLNQRKNSDHAVDPRKAHILSKPIENLQSFNESVKSDPRNNQRKDYLSQKRSRSREKKISKNRQNSEQSFKPQKKDQHFHKTKLCPLFEKGQCKKGAQCHFAHGYKQLRGLPNFFKTRLCLSFEKGECKKSSSECKYAHGQKQLKSLRHDAGYSNSIPNANKDGKSNQNNDYRAKNYEEKRNSYDEKRNKNYDRNDRDNQNYQNRKDRDSESIHRKDKNRKDSNHIQDSRDRRKNVQKQNENPLPYKKNIPLNKQYEKFLYGDSHPKVTEVNSNSFINKKDSLYMVPNASLYPSPVSNYSQEIYPRKGVQIPNVLIYSQIQQRNHSSNQRDIKQNPNKLYNYVDQQSSVPYYEKSIPSQSNTLYNNPRQREGFYPKNSYPEIHYPSLPGSQAYDRQYPAFYQSSNEFVSDFSKDSYKGFNKNGLNDQTYVSENRNVYLKEQFSQSSGYPQVQRIVPSGLQQQNQFAGKQQPFYRKDAYYSVPPSSSLKTSDNNYLKQNGSNNYQNNYPNIGGVYDLYPALDTTVNQPVKYPSDNRKQPMQYPSPYQKSRYGGFSNNLSK